MTELKAVPGVGPAVAKKLKKAFISTAELLAMQNPLDLQENPCKIGEATAEKIVENARNLVGGFGFKSGLELEKEMHKAPRLSFGLPEIDEKLDGGIEGGSIVELYGGARSGKTRWCHHLAVRVQLPEEEGGLGGGVIWFDTEKSFKPKIIRGFAKRWGLEPDVTVENITFAKIIVSSMFKKMINQIPEMIAEEGFALIIFDSFTGLARAEYSGLGTLRERQAMFNKLLNIMRRSGAVMEKCVFLYTNQIMANPTPWGASVKPAGGHILAHGSDYRFYTKLGRETRRFIRLRDNSALPEFEVEVDMGWGGFYKAPKKDKKKKDPQREKNAEMEERVIEYLDSLDVDTSDTEDKEEVEEKDE